MHKTRKSTDRKAVSAILAAVFILFDLSSACPAEGLYRHYSMAVPSIFQAGSHSAPDHGIEIRKVRYERPGVRASGEAFIIDLDKVRIEQSVEPTVVNRDFISKPLSSYDLKGFGRTLREFAGPKPEEKGILLAFNGIHGDYWESSSAVIMDGRLIAKPQQARGIFQNEYTPLNGSYWVLSLDAGNRGVFEIEIKNGRLPENLSVRNGILGPPLILKGESRLDLLDFRARKPSLEGNQITWPREQRMAFSAMGYDGQGRFVRLAMNGDPKDSDNKELSIEELAAVMKELGVADALLMGSSADVQTYNSFSDTKFTCAGPRSGSYSGGVWSDTERPLGHHVLVCANSSDGDSPKDQTAERLKRFTSSKDLLFPILDIAAYLLGDRPKNMPALKKEHMESAIRDDFKGLPLTVNPSEAELKEGVVTIPCVFDDKKFRIYVARRDSKEAAGLAGQEWKDASKEYKITFLPVVAAPQTFKAADATLPKVLLIASNTQDIRLEKNRKSGVFVAPPLGLYRIKSYLEDKGMAGVDVFDPNLHDPADVMRLLTEAVAKNGYDVVGFTITHMNMENEIAIIAGLKDSLDASGGRRPLFIAGGQEAANNYGEWLNIAPLDALALGYGETAMENILAGFVRDEKHLRKRLKDIKGVAFKDDDGSIKVNYAGLISNDTYRSISFEHDPSGVIPYEKYWEHNSRIYDEENLRLRKATLKTIRLFTSSHCPNGCGFCSSSPWLKHAYGKISPVFRISAGEILELVKKNVKRHPDAEAIFFNDDDFLIGDDNGRNRGLEFCRLVIDAKKRGEIPRGLKFYMQTKVNTISKKGPAGGCTPRVEIIRELKKAGFVLCGLGVESFSDRVLASPSMDKKITSEAARTVVEAFLKEGLTPLINIIFLAPETREEDILATISDTARYVDMGAQLSLQPMVVVFPGAPAASKEGRAYESVNIDIPGKGDYTIRRHMLPEDGRIRKVAVGLEAESNRVLENLRADARWTYQYPPQVTRGLTYFIAALNLLEHRKEASLIYELIWRLVERDKKSIAEYTDHADAGLVAKTAYSDLPGLLDLYENTFSVAAEDREAVSGKRDMILAVIQKILFTHVEIEKNKLAGEEIQRLAAFSEYLARDYYSDEAARLLAALNHLFGITRDVLSNNALIDGNIVNVIPSKDRLMTAQELRGEFSGKRVLIMETHQDDALFYIGAAIKGAIAPVAKHVTLASAISDTAGVGDEFIRARLVAKGTETGAMSDRAMELAKKKVREEEGAAVAKALGVNEYVNLSVNSGLSEGRYADGKLRSYYSRYYVDIEGLIKKTEKIIEEQDPDVIICGLPKGAYHQEHRDVSKVLLTVLYRHNRQRALRGLAPVRLYIYPQAGTRDEFLSYGIKPNVVYAFDEAASSEKSDIAKLFESQFDRNPGYADRLNIIDKSKGEGGAYAETMLCASLAPSKAPSDQEDRSVKMALDAARKSDHLRFFVFDGNVCIETRDEFQILPVTTGKRVSDFFGKNRIISAILGISEPAGSPDQLRSVITRVIHAFYADDAGGLAAVISDGKSSLSAEVFSSKEADLLPEKIRRKTWVDEMFTALGGKPEVRVGIHQPGYHRYLGFFEKMAETDIFVFADNLQYVKQEWQNRQHFGPAGEWLTVPLEGGRQTDLIKEKNIAGHTWQSEHWRKLCEIYSREPYFAEYSDFLRTLYSRRWVGLSALNEAMTRFMAKKMGVNPLMIRASYVSGERLRKAAYIANISKKVTERGGARVSPAIVYVSGKGAQYLKNVIDEKGTREEDLIYREKIGLAFQDYDPEKIRAAENIDPYMSGLEFLVKFGKGAIFDINKRKGAARIKKPLSTLISYLSQSNEKERGAEWIVLPADNDTKAAEKCIALYRSSQNNAPKILLVRNWPKADVSGSNGAAEARQLRSLEEALAAAGVAGKDIIIVEDPANLKDAISDTGRIMLVQDPLRLRRSAAILKNALTKRFGAMPAYTLDIDHICGNKEVLKEILWECIKEVRWLQDHLPPDDNGRPKYFLPDDIHDAYDEIFRFMRKPAEELFKELRAYSSREEMLANHGFSNVSILPVGDGSYRIDNRGMPGIWRFILPKGCRLNNRYLLRVADAVSKALNDKVAGDQEIHLSLVDDLSHIPDYAISDERKTAAVLFKEHAIRVTPGFAMKSRNEQEAILRGLIGERAQELPAKRPRRTGVIAEREGRTKPDILVTQIARVTELRSKDYQHYKCSQKTEGISLSLRERGYNSTYLPIEEDATVDNFIKHYKAHREDVVVISIYQVHRKDVETLHKVASSIREANPDAFIVIEGASTDMAKHFLALCPEIDMFVRVESDETIPKLAAMKEKGRPLAAEDIDLLADNIEGGVFIRSGSDAVISRLNISNITPSVRLPAPTRHMFDIWYTERGCPRECLFCRRDQGGVQRYVPADKRIEWLLGRLMLEIDPSSTMTMDALRNELRRQSGGPETLADSRNITLLDDTFIGRDKIRILVVSENALVLRNNIKEFARQMSELGLAKYFVLKIADTDLATVMSKDGPDAEFIEMLRDRMGIDFLGFGTENPSNTFLKWWHKNQSSERPNGYGTDDILKANKALLEAGFSPTGIRHNLILSFPEATYSDVRNAALLIFASPQYNSVPFYFGSGWGNNRFDRTFDVAASFCSSLDHAQYAWTYTLEPDPLKADKHIGTVDLAPYFYVAQGTPEYMVRREMSFLKYIDERLPTWIAKFAHPNYTSFYRYAQKRFLSKYFNDDDVKKAITAWKNPAESDEVKALAAILEHYCDESPKRRPLESLFLLKAHMVSLGMFSFTEFRGKIGKNRDLPGDLERCEVGRNFAKGDDLTTPGSFRPAEAMSCFRKAVLAARLADRLNLYCAKSEMRFIAGICLEENLSLQEKIDRIRSITKNENALEAAKSELYIDAGRAGDIEKEGYLKRISYPDSQEFERLRHLYLNEEDEYLFEMIVHRMNEEKIEFKEAVRELCSERLGVSDSKGYDLYVKAAKEYMKHKLYYCEGGFISRLRVKDALRRAETIESILSELKKEDDPLVIKNIALLLKDMAAGEGLLEAGAYIADSDVITKLQEALDMPKVPGAFVPGPRFAVLGRELHNSRRLRLFREELEKAAPGIHLSPGQEEGFAKGDWVTFRLEKDRMVLKGTRQREEAIVKAYSNKMRFGNNTELFSKYIGDLAQVLDKHRLQVVSEIKEFCDAVGDRPYLRAMMLSEEEFLYALPIVKAAHDHPEMVPLFMARGIEHFYNAWWMMTRALEKNDDIDKALFVKLDGRVRKSEEEEMLVANDINTFLGKEEALQMISPNTWSRVVAAAKSSGIEDALNSYLLEKHGISGGIEEVGRQTMSRRDAVMLLAGFGIDKRFIRYFRMARGTYFPDLMRREKFYSRTDGFPVEEFKDDVEKRNSELEYPLPFSAMEDLKKGLDIMAGKERLLLPMQRNTINNYMIIFGDTPVGKTLRGTITHGARPLLNIILEETALARTLRDKDAGVTTALFVDEATSSASSLYLCELVAKAFAPAISYKTANICQRTADTQKVLQESGVVDWVAKNGLWSLEDINEVFNNIYIDMRGRGKKQLPYKSLTANLWADQMRAAPGVDRAGCIAALERMNACLDGFIKEHAALFEFVDRVPSIRHDPQVIKREMVKNLIKEPDKFRKSMIHDNYYTCAGVSEMDYIGCYILRDGLEELRKRFGGDLPISSELRELYAKFKYADWAMTLEQHMEKQRRMILDFVMIADKFSRGDMAEMVKNYMDGTVDFAQLESKFYETYRNGGAYSYTGRTVYEDGNGSPSYAVVKEDHGRYSVRFFNASGLLAGLSSSDSNIRSLAEAEKERLEDAARRLKAFMGANKGLPNESVQKVCGIAEDALADILKILPAETTPVKVAFFDWDGTVVDTAQAGEKAFTDLYMQVFSAPKEEAAEVWRTLDGKTLSDQYAAIRGKASEKGVHFTTSERDYEDMFIAAKLRNIEASGGINALKVPSAVEFMRLLMGMDVKIHIASGFRRKELLAQISALGLDGIVDKAYGSPTDDSEKVGLPASKAEYIKSVLAGYGLGAKDAIMVGDTPHDMNSGREAGVMAVGRAKKEDDEPLLVSAGAAFVVSDFNDTETILRTIKERISIDDCGPTALFKIAEDFVNNRRARFIHEANRLIDKSAGIDKLKGVAGAPKLKHEDFTDSIKDRVQSVAALIDGMDKKDVPAEMASITDFLKKDIGQLEADAFIAGMIILARKAKRENQKLIVGLETDWIPGMNESGYGSQHDAINALMRDIDAIEEALKSMGLDNVEVVRGSGDGLAGAVLKKADDTKTDLRNIVVMASLATINSPVFSKRLENVAEKDRPFLAGVDPEKLIDGYKGLDKKTGEQLYIRLMQMLCITVELARGKKPDRLPAIISSYNEKTRTVIFLLKSEPWDYEILKKTYAGERTALAAA